MRRPNIIFYLILLYMLWYYNILLNTFISILLAIIGSILVRLILFEKILQRKAPKNSAILITGCSSGFGYEYTMNVLKNKECHIFATVRKLKDKEMLYECSDKSNHDRLHVFLCDVSIKRDVKKLRDDVKEELKKNGLFLWGVVNNAGLMMLGPVEVLPDEYSRKMFEVNVFGVLNICQVFMPLLRKGPSYARRLVIVSSLAGLQGIPFFGQYCASKGAVEQLGDVLRMEGSLSSIKVSVIEPGGFRTKLIQTCQNYVLQDKSGLVDHNDEHVTYLRNIALKGQKQLAWLENVVYPGPQLVVYQFDRVLFAIFPPANVTVGIDSMISVLSVSILPEGIRSILLWFYFKIIL